MLQLATEPRKGFLCVRSDRRTGAND